MILDNKTARDRRLELDSEGFLVHILSYSNEFEIDIDALKNLFEIGREKLLRITNELKYYGYLVIESKLNDTGSLDGKRWTFYDVSQCPDKPKKSRDPAKPNDGQFTSSGVPVIRANRSSGKPNDFKRKTDSKERKTKKKNRKETETETANRAAVRRRVFEIMAFFAFGVPAEKVEFMSPKQKNKIQGEIELLEQMTDEIESIQFFGDWWRNDWRSLDRKFNRFQRPRIEQFRELWFEFTTSDALSVARLEFETEMRKQQNEKQSNNNAASQRFAAQYDYTKFANIAFD